MIQSSSLKGQVTVKVIDLIISLGYIFRTAAAKVAELMIQTKHKLGHEF